MYHSVSDEPTRAGARWTTPSSRFAEHLRMLRDGGWVSLHVSEYAEVLRGERALPEQAMLLTFDDGYRDNLDVALPLLRGHGFTATVYVTGEAVGQTGMLRGRDVRTLADEGVEIGSHSATHPQLDVLPTARAREEVAGSRARLGDLLGDEVATFAYPHGRYSRRTRRLVVEAGYTSACAVKHAHSHLDDDVFAIARLMLEDRHTAEDLADMLTDTVPLGWQRERLRTKAGRVRRRLRSRRVDTARFPARPTAEVV